MCMYVVCCPFIVLVFFFFLLFRFCLVFFSFRTLTWVLVAVPLALTMVKRTEFFCGCNVFVFMVCNSVYFNIVFTELFVFQTSTVGESCFGLFKCCRNFAWFVVAVAVTFHCGRHIFVRPWWATVAYPLHQTLNPEPPGCSLR